MKIRSLTIQNFRSFGPMPTTILLSDMTGLVGTNSCGKSTVLLALSRLFGLSNAERTLSQDDFHVPKDKVQDELGFIELLIEARLEFDELADDDDPGDAVPQCFRQMRVDDPGATPYCRIRLEGKWSKGNLPQGEVEQNLYWVQTSSGKVEDSQKLRMPPHERSRIHVHYVPAARDPLKQIRQASGSIMNRLFKAVNWSDGLSQSVANSSDNLSTSFREEPGIQLIRKTLTTIWRRLHPLDIYSEVHLRPLSPRFEEFLAQVEAVFGPAPVGKELGSERLSDGLKSLFYLTLIGTVFDLERDTPIDPTPLEGEDVAISGISRERLDPPSLTILAVEEPENHLAPHYLGRIMQVLRKIANSPSGQVLLTSHSPSIMRRVEPEEVRYLRLDPETNTTIVKTIKLPEGTEDAYKFVREAVIAFPELYFSKLVVLGEGDSEEIVIPRVAESLGLEIDNSLVSIVPLGGKHVNHFWRLLNGLEIPYLTLLDLDLERGGGGWGRVKYVAKQLLEVGKSRDEILSVKFPDGKTRVLSDLELENMHKREISTYKKIEGWLNRFECYGIYFSAPLDLDFLMQRSFPAVYEVTQEGAKGPTIPKADDGNRPAKITAVIEAVLKENGTDGSTYTDVEKESFFWYRYHFLNKGKPTTHILALAELEDSEVAANAPDVLKRLVAKMKEHLGVADDQETEDAF